jgi:hypothetical protein
VFPSRLVKAYQIKSSLSSPNHDTVRQSIKVIFKELESYSKTTLQSANMENCHKCSTRLIHPPAAVSLNNRFPDLIVNSMVNRSMPRCRHCDEMLANRLALEAELPPPSYKNPITKLEGTIAKLENLVAQWLEEEDDIRTLQSMILRMRRKWANMVRERDAKIKEAWQPYWAIWGIKSGQEGY